MDILYYLMESKDMVFSSFTFKFSGSCNLTVTVNLLKRRIAKTNSYSRLFRERKNHIIKNMTTKKNSGLGDYKQPRYQDEKGCRSGELRT
jgi:hypothetical protein